jgi:hypothetical protein
VALPTPCGLAPLVTKPRFTAGPSLQPKDAAALVRDTRPDAIEHCAQADLLRLSSSSIVSQDLLRRIALVEFCDPKKIDDIGTKKVTGGVDGTTYVKLSCLEIEALRLALHDPEPGLS